MKHWKLTLLLPVILLVITPHAAAQDQDQYLLMQPIRKAVTTGDFSVFKTICREKISASFEPPFQVSGYLYREKFINRFSLEFSQFEATKVEWISQQIDVNFAVQSLNLILKNKRSDKIIYYKFIFFMTKEDNKWKIYYFRGLNI
ncbi:MAG: hypothetical protein GY940_42365 [bacterium]|nr:hypothetical protein [bacterium]